VDLQLSGHTALVTGSTSGIGAAIARSLAAEGAAVIVHGRDHQRAADVCAAIASAPGRAAAVVGDLGTDIGAARVAEGASLAFGLVDILVNNAGGYENTAWSTAEPDDWLAVYNTNVVSAVRLVRLLTPAMRGAGWGRVIQISSGEGTRPFANMPDYSATKAAMNNVTVSLAQDLAGSGVTANTVSPGIVVTAGVEQFYRQVAAREGWGDDWAQIEAGVLRTVLPNSVGRLGRPEEVASLVTFLASPLSGYIDGANLRVDGGATSTVN